MSLFRKLTAGTQVALVAGLPFLPGLAGASTVALFFAEWPSHRTGQLIVGATFGLTAWFLMSFFFLRGSARPEGAYGGAYEQLCVRLCSLRARVAELETAIPPNEGQSDSIREAYRIALAHKNRLEANLLTDNSSRKNAEADRERWSSFRWSFAFGYVNLWRDVHRAEEALLEFEKPDGLYVLAMEDLARLKKTAIEGRDVLMRELQRRLDARKKYLEGKNVSGGHGIRERVRACFEPASESMADPFEGPLIHALVREVRYGLNQRRNDLWERLVHLRVLLLFSMFLTGAASYGLLALAVIQDVGETQMTAGATYYAVGALIGLFGELYGAAQRRRGIVDDYGLATARLLTVPLLAGIAGVGGVVLTRLAGTATPEGLPSLEDIFSLKEYPFGLVVSAIFGLTPGLLLDRLNQQTEAYKKELAQTAPGGSAEPAAQPDPLVPED